MPREPGLVTGYLRERRNTVFKLRVQGIDTLLRGRVAHVADLNVGEQKGGSTRLLHRLGLGIPP